MVATDGEGGKLAASMEIVFLSLTVGVLSAAAA